MKAHGYTCDREGCGTFEMLKGRDVAGRPTGWLRLQLPEVPGDPRPEDNVRDFCSDKCCELFAKERRLANAPAKGTGASAPVMTDALRDYLADLGVTGRSAGQMVGTHTRFHGTKPNPTSCGVCQFEAELEAVA